MQFTLLAALFSTALAAPTTLLLTPRQSSGTTCGSNSYSSSQLSSAVNQGYNYYQEGQTVGSDGYPHQYKDYEGFTFPVSGPYQEFPVLESGAYSGGQPGADRVIFNEQGQYAGTITHTGASSYDGFVGCSGTS